MHKKLILLAALALAIGVSQPAYASSNNNPPETKKINICHATGSLRNPYEAKNVSENSEHSSHALDFAYNGPLDEEGKPDNEDKQADKWCKDHAPKDLCSNIEGIQTTVPEGYEIVDGLCVKKVEKPTTPTTTTTTTTTPQVAATPVKGVSAGGGGGAGSAAASVVALGGSVATLGYGVLRFRKFNV